MQRKILLSLLTLLLLPMPLLAQNREEYRCGTDEGHLRLLKTDKNYGLRQEEIERFIQAYRQFRRELDPGARTNILTIPVVVHVLYNTSGQNISLAQIQSQIDVLNEDYRRLNADIAGVPAPFQPLEADSRIQFQLARRDPQCNPTDGITRTMTTVTTFHEATDDAKSAATGGHDPWPRDKYLNLWVAPRIINSSNQTLLGYARFPGAAANIDGVVIRTASFGRHGTATPPYDLGRTATHEVGHWLGLFHVFQGGCAGTTTGTCASQGDLVCDTPPQSAPNFSCPTFPHNSCSGQPNGDLFVNFMDYTDDNCMFMFTQGQSERMEATLAGPRAVLLGSDGILPPPATPNADLWSADTFADPGTEPNPTPDAMWTSDDIWIRNQNDGFVNQQHQNPLYRPAGTGANYVYVRIRNRGCQNSTSFPHRLYWAKASSGLSWPAPWDGSVLVPALMGGQIGMQMTGVVTGGGFTTLEYAWYPPNPADYAAFGADRAHFCLLSRIEEPMAFAEGLNLDANVRNNNNIVWKNITVVGPGGGREACVTVSNFTKKAMITKLAFTLPDIKQGDNLLRWGAVTVDLGKDLYNRWQKGGGKGQGVEPLGGTMIGIFNPECSLDNIVLKPGEIHALCMQFKSYNQERERNSIYRLRLTQLQTDGEKEQTIGGEDFFLKTAVDTEPGLKPSLIGYVDLKDFLGDPTTQRVQVEIRDPNKYTFTEGHLVLQSELPLRFAREGGAFFGFDSGLNGLYDVAVKGSHWLRQTQSALLSEEGTQLSFSLRNGDANNDNHVDIFDLATLAESFNTVPLDLNWNPLCDFNGDDSTDIFDLAILAENFNTDGDL